VERSKAHTVPQHALGAGNRGGTWTQIGKPQRIREHAADVPERWRDVLALDAEARELMKPVLERRRAAFRA